MRHFSFLILHLSGVYSLLTRETPFKRIMRHFGVLWVCWYRFSEVYVNGGNTLDKLSQFICLSMLRQSALVVVLNLNQYIS